MPVSGPTQTQKKKITIEGNKLYSVQTAEKTMKLTICWKYRFRRLSFFCWRQRFPLAFPQVFCIFHLMSRFSIECKQKWTIQFATSLFNKHFCCCWNNVQSCTDHVYALRMKDYIEKILAVIYATRHLRKKNYNNNNKKKKSGLNGIWITGIAEVMGSNPVQDWFFFFSGFFVWLRR